MNDRLLPETRGGVGGLVVWGVWAICLLGGTVNCNFGGRYPCCGGIEPVRDTAGTGGLQGVTLTVRGVSWAAGWRGPKDDGCEWQGGVWGMPQRTEASTQRGESGAGAGGPVGAPVTGSAGAPLNFADTAPLAHAISTSVGRNHFKGIQVIPSCTKLPPLRQGTYVIFRPRPGQ